LGVGSGVRELGVKSCGADVATGLQYSGGVMAKYGRKASKTVESAMRRRKRGTLKSGSGGKVKSRKQAIAIGLSEARKKGAKVPARKGSRKKTAKKR
jgi:Family of unknown function (DUF6496)